MRIGIVISGNLRTFFMPMRENSNLRVCDCIMNNIIIPNGGDIFAYTDSTDFYYEGKQYYPETKEIEMYTNDTFRIYGNIGFINHENAVNLLKPAIEGIFKNQLKTLLIDKPFDISQDSRLELLKKNDNMGCVPEFILQQHRKIRMGYKLLCNYEESNNFKYDIIIRIRFDLFLRNLNVSKYDFRNVDLYVPGSKGPIIYDWASFGTRNAMHHYLTIYDHIGFPLESGLLYMLECRRCGVCVIQGNNANLGTPPCPHCKKNDKLELQNITLASEHHGYETCKKNNIRFSNYGLETYVYRYRDYANTRLEDELKKMKIGTVTVKTHTPSKDIGKTVFETGN